MLEPQASRPDAEPETTLDDLRARVLERAAREQAPTRAQFTARRRVVLGVCVGISLLLFFVCGGARSEPRPTKLMLETTLGSAALAIGVALLALDRGRSMLGRPRPWLALAVVSTPIALFAWRVLVTARYAGMTAEWTTRPGLRCFILSGALSIAPLLGLLWLRRGSDPVHPRLSAAALAAAAGAGSWVLVDLWCPVGYLPHLLLGHVAPIVVLTALAAVFGSRLIKLRQEP